MNMKLILIAILLGILLTAGVAQSISDTIKSEAQNCATALLQADYDTFVLYTHKRIIEDMGGKSAVIATTKRSMSDMRSKGLTIESAIVGTPGKPLTIGSWIVALVPQRLVIKVPDGRLMADAYLLGISEDAGKKWVFIDDTIGEARFAKAFPELAGKISLPERKRPVFEKDGIVQQGGPANRSQPLQLGTNSTPLPAGSGR
jgi:hypothetical protein